MVERPLRRLLNGPIGRRSTFGRYHQPRQPAGPLGRRHEWVTLLSYHIPTYEVGRRRPYVGVWTHGVSIYGWQQGRDAGFAARHPALKTSKGTIQLRPEDAAAIPDDELGDLVRAALEA